MIPPPASPPGPPPAAAGRPCGPFGASGGAAAAAKHSSCRFAAVLPSREGRAGRPDPPFPIKSKPRFLNEGFSTKEKRSIRIASGGGDFLCRQKVTKERPKGPNGPFGNLLYMGQTTSDCARRKAAALCIQRLYPFSTLIAMTGKRASTRQEK